VHAPAGGFSNESRTKSNTIVVVVVIGEAMHFGVRENPERYDNLDYDNDNDNDANGIPQLTRLTYQ